MKRNYICFKDSACKKLTYTVPTAQASIFIRPSLDGTYYGMALSVRPSVAATAIKPPKAACQFAADDILLYKFCYNIQWIYFTIWEKGKEELSPLQYHFKSLHIISSLYISYQDITRRVC